MDKMTDYGRSNIDTEVSNDQRIHIIGKNIKKQHKRTESDKRT